MEEMTLDEILGLRCRYYKRVDGKIRCYNLERISHLIINQDRDDREYAGFSKGYNPCKGCERSTI